MTIKTALQKFAGKRIMVVGDLMLDHYIDGTVSRISPEAPVPVVDVKKTEYRLGGAANVALNLKSLGADVLLVGISGNDSIGEILSNILRENSLDTKGVFTDPDRPSTLKTRVSSVNQQIVRFDIEDCREITKAMSAKILKWIDENILSCDAVIIEDYNKGLMSQKLISGIIKSAINRNILVAVDPKFKHFFDYKGVSLFKPNYQEMQKNIGKSFDSEEEFVASGFALKKKIGAKYLVVTRGSKGLCIFTDKSEPINIPTFAREVFDVSGAGDTVISAMTMALSCECDIKTAATIANHAASVVCGKHGTATANTKEILDSYNDYRQD